jgi:hypothetical protein
MTDTSVEYSFTRYLLAKQTVDDRAFNRHVLDAVVANLPPRRLRVLEIGAGMGNMLARLLSWQVLAHADYVHEDSMAENIQFASEWIPQWAGRHGMAVERIDTANLRVMDNVRDVTVHLIQQDFSELVRSSPEPADLLIANAFLDLLPLRASLPQVLSLTRDLAWLTINYDGLTAFEPVFDSSLDEQILELYHRSMDERPTGGDSLCGRHLLSHLNRLGARILAAGPSDWVVYPRDGTYPQDEAYFLEYILHFFEESLSNHPELDAHAFQAWLATRRAQIRKGELVYMAHQLDFLVRM